MARLYNHNSSFPALWKDFFFVRDTSADPFADEDKNCAGKLGQGHDQSRGNMNNSSLEATFTYLVTLLV